MPSFSPHSTSISLPIVQHLPPSFARHGAANAHLFASPAAFFSWTCSPPLHHLLPSFRGPAPLLWPARRIRCPPAAATRTRAVAAAVPLQRSCNQPYALRSGLPPAPQCVVPSPCCHLSARRRGTTAYPLAGHTHRTATTGARRHTTGNEEQTISKQGEAKGTEGGGQGGGPIGGLGWGGGNTSSSSGTSVCVCVWWGVPLQNLAAHAQARKAGGEPRRPRQGGGGRQVWGMARMEGRPRQPSAEEGVGRGGI